MKTNKILLTGAFKQGARLDVCSRLKNIKGHSKFVNLF
jgi:hypothetical protein